MRRYVCGCVGLWDIGRLGPMGKYVEEETMFVYQRTEPGLYTVGHYEPNGKWHAESDHETTAAAARRVAWLNGGGGGGPEPAGDDADDIILEAAEEAEGET